MLLSALESEPGVARVPTDCAVGETLRAHWAGLHVPGIVRVNALTPAHAPQVPRLVPEDGVYLVPAQCERA